MATLKTLPGLLLGLMLALALAATPTLAAGATKKKAAPSSKTVKAKAPAPAGSYAQREDAMQLADEIAAREGLDRSYVRRALASANLLPSVARLILPGPPAVSKNWQLYRSRFIEPRRIAAGLKFWQAHRATLERAERRYGVPAEIIVGVIGVETIYGQQMGGFRLLDALATLSLDFPAEHPRAEERRAFFRGELAQFLKLRELTHLDPLQWRGSYAGAMGMPQFMPTSLARFAVDFDEDGRIDLFKSVPDVIGSVANYFKAFQWQTGMPTHYAVGFDATKLDKDALLAPDILPTFDVAGFTARGAVLDPAGLAHKGKLALVELQNGESPPQYLAGTENFYAITRYNWSSYYAMAVIELGREVAQALSQAAQAQSPSAIVPARRAPASAAGSS